MHRLCMLLFCALPLAVALTAPNSFAQTAKLSAPSIQPALSNAPLTLVLIHQQVNDKAVLARTGNPQAIAGLSQTVFQRVGIPVEVADSFHFSQRVAQAETDYRRGVHPAVHEEDLVRANNNLAHTLGAPEWAYTSQSEVRKLRMQFMARYPELLANQAKPDANGRFEALSKNIGPVEAAFLATTLIYQKLYSPEYQLTAHEQATGGVSTIPAAVFQQRTQQLSDILHANTQSLSIFDLIHAADGLFSDLGIDSALRPEFENLPAVNAEIAEKEGR